MNDRTISPFEAASPFDGRYYFPEEDFFERLKPYVSEESQIRYMADVEAEIAGTLADVGICTAEAAAQIRTACDNIDPVEVYREEQRIGHNVRALVNCIRNQIDPDARPYVHLFATSADVTDTARSLALRDVTRDVLLPELAELTRLLIRSAREHAETPQIGRTHGRHAVPVTYGFALALYVSRLGQRLEQMETAAQNLRGKFAGAVGAYNALTLYDADDPAAIEARLMERLGLKPPEISNQVVQPEYVTDLIYACCTGWGVIANLADDIRHLMRSEIAELKQDTESDPNTQNVGSSTMPHKVNPKDFENVKSLWKAYMPRLTTLLMDQVSEHQRDLTNSASGRYVFEFAAAFAYGIRRMQQAFAKVSADTGRMAEILESGKSPIAAEPLYIALALAGHPDAHEKSRVIARQSRIEGKDLLAVMREDRSLDSYMEQMSPVARRILDDPALYTGAAPQRTIAVCEEWERKLASYSGQ